MHSCIYTGWVRHRRYAPTEHNFRYRLYMTFLDLSELDEVFAGRWFWSQSRPAVARFRRSDYLGDPNQSVSDSVRELVRQQTGEEPTGPIRLLTNLRYLGFKMNPVSFYYCYDTEETLTHLVAEVTNTPWGERHCYVMDAGYFRRDDPERTEKEFHVSPFMSLDYQYGWRVTQPGHQLNLHIDSWQEGQRKFDATLQYATRGTE